VTAVAASDSMLKVTQVKSTIGNRRPARESVRSLGLKRIHHSVVVEDNAVNRGYINRATHLLTVEIVRKDGNDEL
jgi:large subunit ribosomal protein L30